MNYLSYLRGLSLRAGRMSSRARCALFWLFGEGLRYGLDAAEVWRDWVSEASCEGFQFVASGEASDACSRLRSELLSLCEVGEMSTHLMSVVACFYQALEESDDSGKFSYEAFFPLMQSESLRLFVDIAQGDDEQEDEVFAQPRVQYAVKYVDSIIDRLLEASDITGEHLLELQCGGEVLSPEWDGFPR